VPLRILFVLQYYYPYIGGLESLFQRLAEGLVRRGHAVRVLTTHLRQTSYHEIMNGVEIERVPVPPVADRYFFTLLSLPACLRAARRSDIVHTTPYCGAPPAFLAAKLTGRPVVFTALEVLGSRWYRVESRRIKAFLYWLLERAVTILPYERIAAISKATLEDAVRSGMDPRRTCVIYPGVDDVFRPGPTTGSLRRLIGASKDAFVYVFYGRPGITKGVDVLLRASRSVHKAVPNAHLVLILAKEPRAQYDGLRRLAEGLEHERVHFIPSLEREKLVDFLRDANCIVVPSLTEGFGLTTAEACALGVPVVATSAGSIPEIISGKHALAEPGSEASLADGIQRVSQGNWDETPTKRFRWDTMVKAYGKLYLETIRSVEALTKEK
jgi:glycosyltransferase involved in cell wall biosynthesis